MDAAPKKLPVSLALGSVTLLGCSCFLLAAVRASHVPRSTTFQVGGTSHTLDEI